MTVVNRLCKDATFWTVTGPRVAGRLGRPRIYGEDRIELAKLARQRSWKTEVFDLYGKTADSERLAIRAPASGRTSLIPSP